MAETKTKDFKEDADKSDADIIKEALDLFEDASTDEACNRANYEADIRFGRLGEQWPENIKIDRQNENRPCLTVNRCPSFVRQVVNDARQNKPSIIVHPIDNGADKDTAEVINGIIRSIERNSNAEVAYDTAIENAVSGGFGFFRVGIDYVDDNSFDMEVRIIPVPNSMSVYWPPESTQFDSSDWNYAFITEDISEDEFSSRYPDAQIADFEDTDDRSFYTGLGDKQVRIAEYWKREEISQTLHLLSDGRTIREDQLTDEIKAVNEITDVSIIKQRESRTHKVTRRIISGKEVLETDEWPGSTIPICPVWGEVVVINGLRYLRSMIADAKGPQQMLNFWKTASTELVALAPKAPYMVEEGSIPEGAEGQKYQTANTRSHAYMMYKRGHNKPDRQPFAGVPGGALQEALNASDDMKSVMGIFDAALGSRGNETSGRAILARQRESDVSNFHFTDNQSRAINWAGKIIVEIIPYVYTPGRVMRILGKDQKEKVVRLAGGEYQPDKQSSNERLYDLTVGKYDVTVKAGPSYASQREETRETIVELIRSLPNAAPEAALILGVKLLEQMDFLGADELAKQIGTLLPEEIRAMRSDDMDKKMTPEARQVIAMAQKEINQLKQQLQQGGQMLQEAQQKAQKLEGDQALASRKLGVEELKVQTESLKFQREKGQLEIDTESRNRLAWLEQNVNNIADAVAIAKENNIEATMRLAEALNAPKRISVVRGQDGKVVGLQEETEDMGVGNGNNNA